MKYNYIAQGKWFS